jgi:hypothetical protein
MNRCDDPPSRNLETEISITCEEDSYDIATDCMNVIERKSVEFWRVKYTFSAEYADLETAARVALQLKETPPGMSREEWIGKLVDEALDDRELDSARAALRELERRLG